MTSQEIQQKVVEKGRSRERKNNYTQGVNRDKVGSGWSDCSSFVRWCWLQVTGIDIGGNTAAQINDKDLVTVHSGGKYPDVKLLQIGDLVYFKGTDKSRPKQVGHVEMVCKVGNTIDTCKFIGHGSGVGPTVKSSAKAYCDSRYNSGKGYIETRRPKIIGVKEYALGDRELKSGCSGKDVMELQSALIGLQFSCGQYGADGDFGADTAAAVKKFQKAYKLTIDGIFGKDSYTMLKSLLNGENVVDPDESPLTEDDSPDNDDVLDKDSDPSTDTADDEKTQSPDISDDTDNPSNIADSSMGTMAKNPYTIPTTVKRKGMKGDTIRWIQWELRDSGYDLGKYGIDGDFGNDTDKAVRAFQKDNGLTVDGEVGSKTRAAMLKETSLPESPDQSTESIVPPSGSKRDCPDVSHHQGTIKWEKVDVDHIWIRIQDNQVLDRELSKNIKGAEKYKVPYSVYAFLRGGTAKQGEAEAELMVKRARNAGANPISWVVDVEVSTNKPAAVKAWCATMRKLLGADVKLGIYIGHHLYPTFKSLMSEFDYVWIPRYNKWKTKPAYPYDIWQGGFGAFKGISGGAKAVDCNRLKPGLTWESVLKTNIKS